MAANTDAATAERSWRSAYIAARRGDRVAMDRHAEEARQADRRAKEAIPMSAATNNNDTRDGLTFQAWFNRVNVIVERVTGMGVDDGVDFPSWDEWDAGATPWEGAIVWCDYNDVPDDIRDRIDDAATVS